MALSVAILSQKEYLEMCKCLNEFIDFGIMLNAKPRSASTIVYSLNHFLKIAKIHILVFIPAFLLKKSLDSQIHQNLEL